MQNILITGASTGIGRATALLLDQFGYRVYATVRSEQDAAQFPSSIQTILLDLQNRDQIHQSVAKMDLREGLFALINNAAINYIASVEDSTETNSRSLVETNFFGPVTLTRLLIPHLRRYAEFHPKSKARIVNISSIGGLIGLPWEPFYHASKFALVGFAESLSLELWNQGIRATVVCPGAIQTPLLPKTVAMAESAIAAASNPHYAAGLRAFSQMGLRASRFGLPAERAATVIAGLINSANPPLRKLIGMDARLMYALSRLLTPTAFHRLMRATFAPA